MKKLTLTVLALALSSGAFAKEINCHVFKVYDGDTVTCSTSKTTNYKQDKKHKIKVRLAQIDAPEAKQDYGIKSRDYLRRLVLNKDVTLDVWEKDRYGRTVAKILLNGEDINYKMVKSGNAWAYQEYVKEDKYLAAQNYAQDKKIGLWADKNPQKPSDFRKGKPKINHDFDIVKTKKKHEADESEVSEEKSQIVTALEQIKDKAMTLFSVAKGAFKSFMSDDNEDKNEK